MRAYQGVAAQCITAGNGKRARELIDEARSYGASRAGGVL